MEINWYPGHMAKAKRLLAQQLSRVDVVIELCDARLPHSSRNPDLIAMTGGKAHLLLLNKSDLAERNETTEWLRLFQNRGAVAKPFDAKAAKVKEAVGYIEQAAAAAVERAALRGVRKTVRAMIIGVPNVGKSTFINRLHGGAITKVGDRPGVTRANQWVKITPYLELLDTPGMLWPRLDDQNAARRLAYIGTIRDEIMDVQMLAVCLLDDLMTVRPDAVAERFRVQDSSLRGVPLLEAVCKGRGFLMKGGVMDTDRGSAVVLDEFRSGKLGRITLEKAKDEKQAARRFTLGGSVRKGVENSPEPMSPSEHSDTPGEFEE